MSLSPLARRGKPSGLKQGLTCTVPDRLLEPAMTRPLKRRGIHAKCGQASGGNLDGRVSRFGISDGLITGKAFDSVNLPEATSQQQVFFSAMGSWSMFVRWMSYTCYHSCHVVFSKPLNALYLNCCKTLLLSRATPSTGTMDIVESLLLVRLGSGVLLLITFRWTCSFKEPL